MRVNIKGRGIVPRVGKLAPVYNQDLQKNDIEFLLNFNQFKVYETKTGLLITKGTVDEMYAKSQKPVEKPVEVKPEPKPVVEKPVLVGVDIAQNKDVAVEQKVPVEVKPIAETPVEEPAVTPDVTEEEVAQSFISDVDSVKEQLPEKEDLVIPVEDTDVESFEEKSEEENVEEVVEEEVESTDTEEEAPVTEEPQQSYPSKKKKKNRR